MLNSKFRGDRDVNLSPATQLYLFDVYVKPILYVSEVQSTANDRNRARILKDPHKQNTVKNVCANKVQTGYCKFILGLGRNASNLATLAELGRYPLDVDMKIKIVKYWIRIISLPDDDILKMSYLNEAELDASGVVCWATSVRLILANNGMYNIWLKQTSQENISRIMYSTL